MIGFPHGFPALLPLNARPFGSVPCVMINGRAVTVSSGSLPGPGPVPGPVGPVGPVGPMTSVTSVTSVAPGQRGMKTIQRAERAEARGVNGEEEDTLSKARKAAKVHLNALKEHVEEAWRGQFGDFNAHPKYK